MTNERPMATEDLDDHTRYVLQVFRWFWETHGWSPSVRELGPWTGLTSSSSVHRHMVLLEQKGYLERYGPQNRYRLTEKELNAK